MKFESLDSRMRIFETAHDHCVLPGLHMVARLDGRNFTRLTRETHEFEAPFDETFRDHMLHTVEHLMDCAFKVTYGYTESDEISLLLDRDSNIFSRKVRKLNSILAGEASAKFSLLLGDIACFDCRISQLPSVTDVVDYFRWRNEDAHRNALSGHCYWCLRKDGKSPREATTALEGVSIAGKNELLFQHGINFNDVPNWQKRGCAVYWEQYSKVGLNPLTGGTVRTERRRLKRDLELPMKDSYSTFVQRLVEDNSAPNG